VLVAAKGISNLIIKLPSFLQNKMKNVIAATFETQQNII